MLAWPAELLLFDVENGLWWPGWGKRPFEKLARAEVVGDAVKRVPKLILNIQPSFYSAKSLE